MSIPPDGVRRIGFGDARGVTGVPESLGGLELLLCRSAGERRNERSHDKIVIEGKQQR